MKAYRATTIVFYPKYVNAEMLLLEFFSNQSIYITPLDAANEGFGAVKINEHVDVLDELVRYINANISK